MNCGGKHQSWMDGWPTSKATLLPFAPQIMHDYHFAVRGLHCGSLKWRSSEVWAVTLSHLELRNGKRLWSWRVPKSLVAFKSWSSSRLSICVSYRFRSIDRSSDCLYQSRASMLPLHGIHSSVHQWYRRPRPPTLRLPHRTGGTSSERCSMEIRVLSLIFLNSTRADLLRCILWSDAAWFQSRASSRKNQDTVKWRRDLFN